MLGDCILRTSWISNSVDESCITNHAPSFISDDPDFAPTSSPHSTAAGGSDGEELLYEHSSPIKATSRLFPACRLHQVSSATGSTQPASRSTRAMGSAQLNPAGSYFDLPEEARSLDAMLYSILKMCVHGSKKILLDCVFFLRTFKKFVFSRVSLTSRAMTE